MQPSYPLLAPIYREVGVSTLASFCPGPHHRAVYSEGPNNRASSLTALHLGACCGDPVIVRALLDAGATQVL